MFLVVITKNGPELINCSNIASAASSVDDENNTTITFISNASGQATVTAFTPFYKLVQCIGADRAV